MSDEWIQPLLSAGGLLGPVVIALGIACARLQKRCDEIQEKRVEDAKKVSETLLSMAEEQNNVTMELLRSIQEFSSYLERIDQYIGKGSKR